MTIRKPCYRTAADLTETFIAAVYTPPEARSPELRAAVATSDQLISELKAATEYVFGVPMYNFSVPAGFKAYIDQIVVPGRTYRIEESGCKKGLLREKKATVITSSGWLFRNGSPLAPYNHQEPWIRTILGFIGVTNVDFVVADGLGEVEGKREREQYLKPIREEVLRKAALRLPTKPCLMEPAPSELNPLFFGLKRYKCRTPRLGAAALQVRLKNRRVLTIIFQIVLR